MRRIDCACHKSDKKTTLHYRHKSYRTRTLKRSLIIGAGGNFETNNYRVNWAIYTGGVCIINNNKTDVDTLVSIFVFILRMSPLRRRPRLRYCTAQNRILTCHYDKNWSEILENTDFWAHPVCEVFLNAVILQNSVPKRLPEYHAHSVFKNLSIKERCLVNMNILDPKFWTFQIRTPKQNGDFSRKWL
jgi:hypothetical protein